jgi:adenylate cyclase
LTRLSTLRRPIACRLRSVRSNAPISHPGEGILTEGQGDRVAVVFISYERSAEAKARQVGEVLERGGHQPWSDALLPPHRDYSQVIEEHLQTADVVLVLWSHAASQSQWVRAEADYARERQKLVQATLDDSIPPMPFNQIHCANLAGWNGAPRQTEWLKVLESIEQVAGAPVQTPQTPQGARPAKPRRWIGAGPLALAALGMAAAAILVGSLWLFRGSFLSAPAPEVARVAILPFDTLSSNPDAKFFADSLADQIGTTLSDNHIQVVSHDDAVTLRGPDREKRLAELDVGYLLDGTVQNNGKTIKATVHLDDPAKHVTLWSGDVEGPANQAPLLQTRLSSTIVYMLACSKRAMSPAHGLADPALLTRYLHACDIMGNHDLVGDTGGDVDILTALREVTVGAPDFGPAHSDLAMYSAVLAKLFPPDQATAMRREAASEATRALSLDPKSPEAYVARAELLPRGHWADREKILRTALELNPNSGNVNGFLAGLLGNTGRLHEAVQVYQKAASVDLQLDWAPDASYLAGMVDGQSGRCIDDLTKYKGPEMGAQMWYELGDCMQVAGRWDDATALADDAADRPALVGTANPTEAAYLQAGKTRAPADMAKARALLQPTPADITYVVYLKFEALSYLGYVDDAFAAADRWAANGGRDILGTRFLFLPKTAPMRRDPRFMKLATRLGLVDFWRSTGHWPDFCSEPGLPYDCRAEAARAVATISATKS